MVESNEKVWLGDCCWEERGGTWDQWRLNVLELAKVVVSGKEVWRLERAPEIRGGMGAALNMNRSSQS